MPLKTTAGQLLINSALPPAMRDYNRVLDKKGAGKLYADLARQYPDEYREISKRLADIARDSAHEFGGYSFGIKHLQKSEAARGVMAQIGEAVKGVLARKDLTPKQRDELIIKATGGRQKELVDAVYKEALAAKNPLAFQVLSGSRGNPVALNSLLGGDLLYENHKGDTVPVPITRSYSEGLTPAQHWVSSYGARFGLVGTKLAVAKSGYFSKQLSQATHRLVVEDADDPDEKPGLRGLPVDTNDPDNEGALLAHDIGGYKRNTVLTPKILKDLQDKGEDRLLVRSAITSAAPSGGVYARDIGIKETGSLPSRGSFVGLQAAQSVGEPLSQGMLCLMRGTLVRMADGTTKKIEDIRIGDWVLGADKAGNAFPVRVVRTYDNGRKECYRSEFRYQYQKTGMFIDSTLDHKILGTRCVSGTKAEADNWKPGIWPIGQKAKYFYAVPVQAIRWDDTGKENCEFAQLLGWLLADGCYTESLKGEVHVSCADQSLIDAMNEYLEPLGYRITFHKGSECYWRVSWLNDKIAQRDKAGRVAPGVRSPLKKLMIALAMMGLYAHEKTIPPDVGRWNIESIRKLLRGMFSGDGTAYPGEDACACFGYGSTSRPMIAKVAELLETRFGIPCGKIHKNSHKGERAAGIERKTMYTFAVTSQVLVKRFNDAIGIEGKRGRKLTRLLRTYAKFPRIKRQPHFARRVKQTRLGMRRTHDIEVDHPDHLFVLANGLIVSNSSKHGGGVAGQSKNRSGFPLLDAMIQVPHVFPGGATHAEEDGRITDIKDAPAGGKIVMIGQTEHYVPPGLELKVKKGDEIEAGDVLSDGHPNPATLAKHKGLGEAQRYFTGAFQKAMGDFASKPHRRNIEVLARGLINHVRFTNEHGEYAPDDVAPYSLVARNWQPREGTRKVKPLGAMGKYLESPVLHYTIGTKIRPSVVRELAKFKVPDIDVHDNPPPFESEMIRAANNLQHDPDWMVQQYGSGLKGSLLDSAHRSKVSDPTGSSFVPSLAKAVDFGNEGLFKRSAVISAIEGRSAVLAKMAEEIAAGERPYRDRAEMYAIDGRGRVFGGLYPNGNFGVFGGGVDPGETPVEAAAREFPEECGYEVTDARMVPVDPHVVEWKPPYKTAKQAKRAKEFKGSRTFYVVGKLGKKIPGAKGDEVGRTEVRPYTLAEARKLMGGDMGDPELAEGILRRHKVFDYLEEFEKKARAEDGKAETSEELAESVKERLEEMLSGLYVHARITPEGKREIHLDCMDWGDGKLTNLVKERLKGYSDGEIYVANEEGKPKESEGWEEVPFPKMAEWAKKAWTPVGKLKTVADWARGRKFVDPATLPAPTFPNVGGDWAQGEMAAAFAARNNLPDWRKAINATPNVHLGDRVAGGAVGGAAGYAADSEAMGPIESGDGAARRLAATAGGAYLGGRGLNASLNTVRRYITNTTSPYGYATDAATKPSLAGFWRHGVKDKPSETAFLNYDGGVDATTSPRYELLRRYFGVHSDDKAKDYFLRQADGTLRLNPDVTGGGTPFHEEHIKPLVQSLRRAPEAKPQAAPWWQTASDTARERILRKARERGIQGFPSTVKPVEETIALPGQPQAGVPRYSLTSAENPMRRLFGSHDTFPVPALDKTLPDGTIRQGVGVGDLWDFALPAWEKQERGAYLKALAGTSPSRWRDVAKLPVGKHVQPQSLAGMKDEAGNVPTVGQRLASLLARTGISALGKEPPLFLQKFVMNHKPRKMWEGILPAYTEPTVGTLGTTPRLKSAELRPDTALQPQQSRVADEVAAQQHDTGRSRMLLYHGLGSGKTLSALAAAEALGAPATAIVPASLRNNFVKERDRFVDPSSGVPMSVMSHTGLALGNEAANPDTLIVDEAQRFRNAGSKQTEALLEAAKRAKNVLLLSGTPVVNSPADFAPMYSILTGKRMPGRDFTERYTSEGDRPNMLARLFGAKETGPGLIRKDELRRNLAGKIDYHKPAKSDVEVQREDINVDLSPEQERVINRMMSDVPESLMSRALAGRLSERDMTRFSAFLTGPRQVGLSTAPFKRQSPSEAFAESPKLQAAMGNLRKVLDENPKAKALIFSNFIDAGIKPYAAGLADAGIPAAAFTGELSDKERKAVVDDYNNDRLRAVLLGPSGTEGLSFKGTRLTQELDPHWNTVRGQQAAGRGLRYDSHDGMPDAEKNMRIERYFAKGREHKPGWFGRLLGRETTHGFSSDDYIRESADRKAGTTTELLELLQEIGTRTEKKAGPTEGMFGTPARPSGGHGGSRAGLDTPTAATNPYLANQFAGGDMRSLAPEAFDGMLGGERAAPVEQPRGPSAWKNVDQFGFGWNHSPEDTDPDPLAVQQSAIQPGGQPQPSAAATLGTLGASLAAPAVANAVAPKTMAAVTAALPAGGGVAGRIAGGASKVVGGPVGAAVSAGLDGLDQFGLNPLGNRWGKGTVTRQELDQAGRANAQGRSVAGVGWDVVSSPISSVLQRVEAVRQMNIARADAAASAASGQAADQRHAGIVAATSQAYGPAWKAWVAAGRPQPADGRNWVDPATGQSYPVGQLRNLDTYSRR